MAKNKKSKSQSDWLKKAYDNPEFLKSPAARSIRVLTEMIEPADRLRKNKIHNTVVFFGSARTLPLKEAKKNLKAIKNTHSKAYKKAECDLRMAKYYEDTADLAEKLTHWFNESQNKKKRFRVCSGGGPGIMEAANLGAKRAKGESIGLNISLPMEQAPNPYQTPNISFDFHYFFIRKFWFFYLSKAMIVFPGGFGTFDEFFELLTLVQTEKTKKHMPIVLYGSEYWNEVVNFKALAKWGMISERDLKLFRICDNVDDAFNFLKKELVAHLKEKDDDSDRIF